MTRPSFSLPSWRARAEGIALLAVIALLALLAVLQSRWLGAIAEAERRKLTEEATEKAATIAQEIDRELTRVFLELRVDAKMLQTKQSDAFAEQLERFRAEAVHQALVKEVFVAERPDSGTGRLLRFDPAARAFVEAPWPESMAPVRAAVEAAGDLGTPVRFPTVLSLPPVMADVPALLAPVVNVVVNHMQGQKGEAPRVNEIREMFMRHVGRGPVEILLLDPAYLREQIVGRIATRRLGALGPFEWSVMRGENGAPIMGERATTPPDAKAGLLRLRFDDLDRSLLRGVLPALQGVSESSVRLVVQMDRGAPAPPQGQSGPSNAPWTLQVRHREGSIDAAVRAQQRRNNVLSASILGVLGLSAGLVFFSARRLRQAATRQVEFVAAVSHELRTPLSVIRSAAENLADGVVHQPGQAARYGALIRDESVRLSDMVEHVLEFAGADSPGRAARGPVDAVEAARSALTSMAALRDERGARIEIEAPDEPLRVNGDMSHLTRAISNLLGNALKYGGESPQVTLRVQRVAGGVVISVLDHGLGLEPSEISRLFEPFYRGQRASEAHIPGSGLGLALVKRIVESHGGRVSAANTEKGGALFTIELPAA
jgi:signal transduction histidine kinase